MIFVEQHGQEIRQLLPVVDDSASRKKTLWKSVFEGFDRIDGVPTQKEREVCDMYTQREIDVLHLFTVCMLITLTNV